MKLRKILVGIWCVFVLACLFFPVSKIHVVQDSSQVVTNTERHTYYSFNIWWICLSTVILAILLTLFPKEGKK